MPQRIYKVSHDGRQRLVRANSQAVARSHVAKDAIQVEVASPDDTYQLAVSGVKVEETSLVAQQMEIGEAT